MTWHIQPLPCSWATPGLAKFVWFSSILCKPGCCPHCFWYGPWGSRAVRDAHWGYGGCSPRMCRMLTEDTRDAHRGYGGCSLGIRGMLTKDMGDAHWGYEGCSPRITTACTLKFGTMVPPVPLSPSRPQLHGSPALCGAVWDGFPRKREHGERGSLWFGFCWLTELMSYPPLNKGCYCTSVNLNKRVPTP